MALQRMIGRLRQPYLSIGAFLAIGLAALVGIPLLVVFAVSLGTAVRNTNSLLEDRARLLIALLTDETRAFIAPAEAAPTFIADLVDRGALDPNDSEAVAEAIRYSFAAAPQLSSVVFINAKGWSVAAIHDRRDDSIGVNRGTWKDNPVLVAAVENVMRQGSRASWGKPTYIEDIKTSVIYFAQPILRDGQFVAATAGSIRLSELSQFMRDLSETIGDTGFILLGKDGVLAHRSMADGKAAIGPDQPIPRVTDVGDSVLATIWSANDWRSFGERRGQSAHRTVGGTEYMLFTVQLDMPGSSEPWLVGGYVDHSLVTMELRRLGIAGGVGAFAILLAIAAALWVSRLLGRPVVALAQAFEHVRRLELDRFEPLAASSLIEMDQAASAFNRMVGALRLFSRYVPRRLVELLLERGEAEAMVSREREATVMFTDLAGFSRMAENMTADECAQFLNRHLSLLTACIEAEGGTVDKFIGDAVMAFWLVAPNASDPASAPLAAVRAALAIRAGIRAENAARNVPLRVRVGMHTGRVIIGNIGTPTRLNFTLVGKTVNIAQRVEAKAKQVLPDADVSILVSATTATLLPRELAVRSEGEQQLEGVDTPIELFTVLDQPGPEAE
jgi:class 3 adenylate cyclase